MIVVITFAVASVLPRNTSNGTSGDSALRSIATNAAPSSAAAASSETVERLVQPLCVARVSA